MLDEDELLDALLELSELVDFVLLLELLAVEEVEADEVLVVDWLLDERLLIELDDLLLVDLLEAD